MKVYLDNNRISKADEQVLEAMEQAARYRYADPAARHSEAITAKEALDQAYEKIRVSIHARENDLISIGSSADALHCNLLMSVYLNSIITGQKNQIILSACESDAVIETASYLATQGCRITILPLNSDGIVDIDMLRQVITPKTALVSITMADSQSGAIMPIDEAVPICKESEALLHSDATHAIGKIPIDVQMLDIDYMSISAYTVNGTTGVAAMFIKEGMSIPNLIQPSKDNTGIVALGKALELASDAQAFEMEDVREYRDMLEEAIREIPESIIITPWALRTQNTILAGFKGVSGSSLVWEMNRYGIAVSEEIGRAAVENIGADMAYRHTLVSFALSRYTTKEEIEYTIEKLKHAVTTIRDERTN